MEIETRIVCSKCGKAYSKRKGFFPVSYASQHKGIGYLTICRTCIDTMFNDYLIQCTDPKLAVRQMCRKLDLYWDDNIYNYVVKRSDSGSLMSKYMSKLTATAYVGKSYDDTLIAEDTLWKFKQSDSVQAEVVEEKIEEVVMPEVEPVSEEIMTFWGEGYTQSMYHQLEKRRQYWMKRFPAGLELDIGTEAIIRQICSLELDINRDRAAGKSVDKNVNTLNTLLGSMNLKPVQKREDSDASINSTPFGVWIYRFENKRPIPDTYKDSPLLKYVFTWMGHVLKMLGVKNRYEQLYQEEIERLRVEKPEYDGDDDEDFLLDVMNEADPQEGYLDGQA